MFFYGFNVVYVTMCCLRGVINDNNNNNFLCRCVLSTINESMMMIMKKRNTRVNSVWVRGWKYATLRLVGETPIDVQM